MKRERKEALEHEGKEEYGGCASGRSERACFFVSKAVLSVISSPKLRAESDVNMRSKDADRASNRVSNPN